MPIINLLESAAGLRIFEYRCAAGPSNTPFTEVFDDFSLSYVARGSFGCCTRGRRFELVAGSFLVGRSGDEYRCSHEHHDGGDECLSFHWSSAAALRACRRGDFGGWSARIAIFAKTSGVPRNKVICVTRATRVSGDHHV